MYWVENLSLRTPWLSRSTASPSLDSLDSTGLMGCHSRKPASCLFVSAWLIGMIVYVPVGNGPLRREIIAAGHGMIVSCSSWQMPYLDCPWVVDNGAFTYWKNGLPFNDSVFHRVVSKLVKLQSCQRPEWVVCPDKVADPASLSFSVEWRRKLSDELRWYLAIQDGMTEEAVESALSGNRFHGLFVGGSTSWKNSTASSWCDFGKSKELPVHIGRVNGWKRLQWAVTIGADSVDGTGWTRAPHWLEYLKDLPTIETMLPGI